MRQAKYRFFLLPLFFVLACAGLYAQSNSELTGSVTDQTGAVVSGATVTITDPATGGVKSTVSGTTGLYDIPGLNPATYNMKVTAKGFEAFSTNGLVVNVSSTVRVDVKLTVGAETETVTVEADALAVQADSNVVSSLISSEQISEIATENRNFAALAALGLGVSSALPANNTPSSVGASFMISVNGLRESHNIWLIDGGEADDRGGAGGMDIMPSQDAIAEFNMLTSNYPPDYGISSGATMSLSLKSGTQKFKGSLWEFNRNTDFNANQVFNKTSSTITPRSPVHYNIFGGNVGGPLVIPHVYNANRNKTFFFWNEEWRRIIQPNNSQNSQAIDAADFPTSATTDLTYVAPKWNSSNTIHVPSVPTTSWYYLNVLKPHGLTPGATFANNKIPAYLYDADGYALLTSGFLPPPTDSTKDMYVKNPSFPTDIRDDVVRIDHNINDKWAILGHYMHDAVTQNYGVPFLGWLWASYNTVGSTMSNPANSAAIKLTGTITPNLLLETSINYDGNIINIDNTKITGSDAHPSNWVTQNPLASSFAITKNMLPQVVLESVGTSEDAGSSPWHNAAQDFEPKVDISYTMGKHAMKYGFSFNHYTKNQQLFGDEQGAFHFGTLTGDSAMDLLLGLSGSNWGSQHYQQFQATPIRHYVNNTPSAYVNDNWHVTPRLTLQVGLRYDALPHAWERSNAVSNFNPKHFVAADSAYWLATGAISQSGTGITTIGGTPYFLNGMDLAGKYGTPRGLVTNDYETLQPRMGFSEDMFGNGKTVLRGGFGTFFERMQGNDIYNAATSAPYAYQAGLNNVMVSKVGFNYLTGENTNTSGNLPAFPTGATSIASTYKAPAIAQFSLGVQHELAPSVIWVVQYVGNIAWHQNIDRPINNFPLSTPMEVRKAGGGVTSVNGVALPTAGQGWIANNSASFRTYNGFNSITQQENTTNGNYNGFQTGVRLQNKWGLSGEADYTWSHEIDLTTTDLSTVSNPWNLKYDKGSGGLDRRHMLNINYMYKLPFFAHSQGMIHSVLGGWEVSGTAVWESGMPEANSGGNSTGPNYGGSDTIGLGGGYTNRPNQSGKTRYPKKFNAWFDISQFSNPTPAWEGGVNQGFGNAGRDAIVGPGRVDFTTSLYKTFAFTERINFQLRVETFNTFNHTEWNGVDEKTTDGNFGAVTSAQDKRGLQLGGRFNF